MESTPKPSADTRCLGAGFYTLPGFLCDKDLRDVGIEQTEIRASSEVPFSWAG